MRMLAIPPGSESPSSFTAGCSARVISVKKNTCRNVAYMLNTIQSFERAVAAPERGDGLDGSSPESGFFDISDLVGLAGLAVSIQLVSR